MTGQTQLQPITEADFSGVLQALSSTAKGRAFLTEYLRRYRPKETRNLLNALQRIEATVRILRDQAEPERLGEELRRIATTLDIAVEDLRADPAGDGARRTALLVRASADLSALAASLTGQRDADQEDDGPLTRLASPALTDTLDTIEDDLVLLETFDVGAVTGADR